MGTRKNNKKSKKFNKRFRKTRSKRQRGGNPSEKGCIGTLKMLLESGINAALLIACHYGNIKIVELLLDNGADVNTPTYNNNYMPLMTASIRGHIKIVRKLLDAGAVVNAQDDGGWTALHLACYDGHMNIVELLLDNGADLMALKDLLGHESLSSTQIYTHVQIKKLKDAYNQAHPHAK